MSLPVTRYLVSKEMYADMLACSNLTPEEQKAALDEAIAASKKADAEGHARLAAYSKEHG